MAFSYPEWENVAYGYLSSLYGRLRKPVPAKLILASMRSDVPEGKWKLGEVEEALGSLEGKELIAREGRGYLPLTKEVALRLQLGMEEVKPFTREPGEVPESHMDKVWSGDIRDLVKPTFGNEYGLYPVSQYNEEKIWKGLTLED